MQFTSDKLILIGIVTIFVVMIIYSFYGNKNRSENYKSNTTHPKLQSNDTEYNKCMAENDCNKYLSNPDMYYYCSFNCMV